MFMCHERCYPEFIRYLPALDDRRLVARVLWNMRPKHVQLIEGVGLVVDRDKKILQRLATVGTMRAAGGWKELEDADDGTIRAFLENFPREQIAMDQTRPIIARGIHGLGYPWARFLA
jgi:hypothetical protein